MSEHYFHKGMQDNVKKAMALVPKAPKMPAMPKMPTMPNVARAQGLVNRAKGRVNALRKRGY